MKTSIAFLALTVSLASVGTSARPMGVLDAPERYLTPTEDAFDFSSVPAVVCGFYQPICGVGEHWVMGPGPGVLNVDATCTVCVYGECHPGCQPEEEDEDTQLAYRALMEALKERDIETVLTLGPRLERYVTFNADRGAIQVLNCDRSLIIATLPLTVITD